MLLFTDRILPKEINLKFYAFENFLFFCSFNARKNIIVIVSDLTIVLVLIQLIGEFGGFYPAKMLIDMESRVSSSRVHRKKSVQFTGGAL
jgi:hypothetical protein